jgi:Sec-independent protein translocase protein TatA
MELAMFGIGPTELLLLAVVVGIVVLIVRAKKR